MGTSACVLSSLQCRSGPHTPCTDTTVFGHLRRRPVTLKAIVVFGFHPVVVVAAAR